MTEPASGIPASAPKPQDRKPKKAPARKKPAATARQAEAEDGFVTLEHCGVSLRIPVGGKLPIAALDAFIEGNDYLGTKLTVGVEQWKALSDAGMTRDGLNELGNKLEDLLGN